MGSCSEDIHMEEEKVEVKVQAEEEEKGETHGREQGEEKGENKQSLRRMTHGWDDAHQHLSHAVFPDNGMSVRTVDDTVSGQSRRLPAGAYWPQAVARNWPKCSFRFPPLCKRAWTLLALAPTECFSEMKSPLPQSSLRQGFESPTCPRSASPLWSAHNMLVACKKAIEDIHA